MLTLTLATISIVPTNLFAMQAPELLPTKQIMVNEQLLIAMQSGSVADVEAALTAGADQESKQEALEYAISCKNNKVTLIEKTRALINAKVDINLPNQCDYTPLMTTALFCTSTEMVTLLINAQADLDVPSQRGATALYQAITSDENSTHIVQALINAKASVNTQHPHDQTYKTALIKATYYTNNDIVRALLAAGADLNVVDSFLGTALEIANRHKYTHIKKTIKAEKIVRNNIRKQLAIEKSFGASAATYLLAKPLPNRDLIAIFSLYDARRCLKSITDEMVCTRRAQETEWAMAHTKIEENYDDL